MWLAVLVVDDDLCFCFRFCSLHLICRAPLTALLHNTYILSYPYPLEIYLGHAPWTCTLDMHLGTLDATCHTFFFFGFYRIRSAQVEVRKVARSLATLEPG